MTKARGTKSADKFTAPNLASAIEDQRRSGASWAAVATALGLKGPGAARTTYTAATGKHHNNIEGVAVTRAPRQPKDPNNPTPTRAKVKKVDLNPHWNEDSDQDEMIAMLEPEWRVSSKGMRELAHATRIKTKRLCRNAGNYVLEDEFVIQHLKGFKFDKEERNLLVEFHDTVSGGYHCIRVQDIVEVVR